VLAVLAGSIAVPFSTGQKSLAHQVNFRVKQGGPR